jgi:hypothetical protein
MPETVVGAVKKCFGEIGFADFSFERDKSALGTWMGGRGARPIGSQDTCGAKNDSFRTASVQRRFTAALNIGSLE